VGGFATVAVNRWSEAGKTYLGFESRNGSSSLVVVIQFIALMFLVGSSLLPEVLCLFGLLSRP